MVKIFLAGATGYIGGDALYTIVEAHPEYDITCLVRNAEKAALLTSQYPSLSTVIGDLDDSDLLAEQVAKADIICHLASCEHLSAVQAISKRLSRPDISQATKSIIHLSGSDILCLPDLTNQTYGTHSDKFHNDIHSIHSILSLPSDAPHQAVDATITHISSANPHIKTAIVCPPTIYGPGRGPGNTRSIQVPELASHILKRGSGFSVERGENRWSTVHVHDVSALFLALVEDAAGGAFRGTWGVEGFYFAASGVAAWGDVAGMVVREAVNQGFLRGGTGEVEKLGWEEADGVWEFASLFWGTNSLCVAERAREVLGWVPRGQSLVEEIEGVVRGEAGRLGMQAVG
ncbi:NAD(P)-binding protein [Aaosphaeria arxii CBS 175.79]|uniref:NAD(P)-binding protein n=1 Tax=Aaosphaeria arxii CBS 175.79 TaxID=1450172 RepID=A0A6A5XNT7_9PLEO|nr:NAD(P)-binding protein [Aaosphaeria arxii CBS 175.79]KAF2014559.1 NAD(P)-binding protein [Aaosphaeria arxii CBS 175.79]